MARKIRGLSSSVDTKRDGFYHFYWNGHDITMFWMNFFSSLREKEERYAGWLFARRHGKELNREFPLPTERKMKSNSPTKLEAEGEWGTSEMGTVAQAIYELVTSGELDRNEAIATIKLNLETTTEKARRDCAEEIINHLTETREQFERSSIDGLMSVLTLEGIIKGLRHRYLDGENSQPNA